MALPLSFSPVSCELLPHRIGLPLCPRSDFEFQCASQVIKGNLNPVFNTVMVFPNRTACSQTHFDLQFKCCTHQTHTNTAGDFTGLTARVWDKHRFRPDKHMGQVTVKFNVAKLQARHLLRMLVCVCTCVCALHVLVRVG